MGFGQATPQPCLGPLQGEQEGQKDLASPTPGILLPDLTPSPCWAKGPAPSCQ